MSDGPHAKAPMTGELSSAPTAADRRAGREARRLSFAQRRLWFIEQIEPGRSTYNMTAARRLRGSLDVDALARSIQDVSRRHAVLRASIEGIDGAPVQIVHANVGVELTVRAAPPGADSTSALNRVMADEAAVLFDLRTPPLLRPVLWRLGTDDHVLQLTIHHIVADGWSIELWFDEVAEGYAARRLERAAVHPDLPVQYADFAEWQQSDWSARRFEPQLAYWRKALTPLPPPLELPLARPRPALGDRAGQERTFAVPRAVGDALEAMGRREGATLFMTLLAAFNVLLSRYSGQTDIVVGTPASTRPRVELESLIGLFVNMLVLRTDLSGDPLFRDLLARVRETALEGYDHRDLPFEQLVESLQPERRPGQTPLFQVVFALQRAWTSSTTFHDLETTKVPVSAATTAFDLNVTMVQGDEGLTGVVYYSTELFESALIDRLISHFQVLLAGIAAHPDARLSDLPLLAPEERTTILDDWNRTSVPVAARSVPDAFAVQVRERPDHVAVVFGGEALTYAGLEARANQLARYLRERGVARDVLVGLCLERSIDVVVAMLATLKAGGAYVPLDPTLPGRRLADLAGEIPLRVVLTHARHLASLSAVGAETVCLDDAGVRSQVDTADPASDTTSVDGEQLAYVLFTSGSMGRPKAVGVPHRAVVRLVSGVDYATLGPGTTTLQLAPLSFDAATFELWGALLNGGRVVLFPGREPSLQTLDTILREQQVSCLWLTSSLFNLIVDEEPGILSGVGEILTGGEALSVEHVRRALDRLPGTTIINGYGPTETTTFACCHRVERPLGAIPSIPIGRPIANTTVFVLDERQRPVPIGVPGELYIGGAGVARGYINDEALTAARFIRNPFSDDPSALVFRTGDRVRWKPDGTLEFLGRFDDQVKVRGFRVEPGEIEATLRQHPRVRNAAVRTWETATGRQLTAYVVAAEADEPGLADELRTFLRARLPDYLVPASLMIVPGIPLTANGKVNRAALPAPTVLPSPEPARAPADDIERQLVEIWEDVLGISGVRVDQSFFDIGGHSLLAAKLFARIERILGRTLPLATLFQGPTIAHLARQLRGDPDTGAWSCLVRIRAAGTRPPLFCLHGIGGNVLGFYDLAKYLHADQPVYGLQSYGLHDTNIPDTTIEAMAERYLREVRAVQPHGPYFLAGMSLGGVVAYEMAQQIARSGEHVGLLAMFDSWQPRAWSSMPRMVRYRLMLNRDWQRARLHVREFLFEPDRWQRVMRKARTVKRRTKNRWWQLQFRAYQRMGRPMPVALRRVFDANRHALQSYVAAPYPGRITLFRASVRGLGQVDASLGWNGYATGGIDVQPVPGTHVTLLQDPYVQDVAASLSASLERAYHGSAASATAEGTRVGGAPPGSGAVASTRTRSGVATVFEPVRNYD